VNWTIHNWDVMRVPWPIESESVQCIVTSPPYWGLRDYGTARWEGGDPTCGHIHQKGGRNPATSSKQLSSLGTIQTQYSDVCRKCGAVRHDAQLGLERTPEEYLERMVAVFREARRVLRKDGTLWLNMGDCYAGNGGGGGTISATLPKSPDRLAAERRVQRLSGLKPKDLVGMPWRLAFALQADGWWLRSDIVWAKPNPMPESITDRPTRAHEYVFLLTKSRRYFYDADAIRTPIKNPEAFERPLTDHGRIPSGWDVRSGSHGDGSGRYKHDEARRTSQVSANRVWNDADSRARIVAAGANARTVWDIPTVPYADAHFATFPTELARRCVLAGTSEAGACAECGSPWVRKVERTREVNSWGKSSNVESMRASRCNYPAAGRAGDVTVVTTEFAKACSCTGDLSVPCLVLDPFAGAGTTLLVADILGRRSVGLELNPAYIALAEKRIRAPRTEAEAERVALEDAGQISMFEANT
jgi:site-specific DNA-methyltransferase (cytosine-N4-specific)